MPQGKGTYGDQVGRPPKKKKLTQGGMDTLYGVEKDVNKMAQSNAQDRVKKYAVGNYVQQSSPTLTNLGPGADYTSDFWQDKLEDDFNMADRQWNDAKEDYLMSTYGGKTSYDITDRVAKELATDRELGEADNTEVGMAPILPPGPHIPPVDPDEPGDDIGGGDDLPNPFGGPGEGSVGGGPSVEPLVNEGDMEEVGAVAGGMPSYEEGGVIEEVENEGAKDAMDAEKEMKRDEIKNELKEEASLEDAANQFRNQLSEVELEASFPVSDARQRRG